MELCWKPIAGLAKTMKNECTFLLCSGGGYQTIFLRHQNSFLFVEERSLVEEVLQRREPMKDEETIRCSFCFINACEEKQDFHFIFYFFVICHLLNFLCSNEETTVLCKSLEFCLIFLYILLPRIQNFFDFFK